MDTNDVYEARDVIEAVGDRGPDDCDAGREGQSGISCTSTCISTGGNPILLLNRGLGMSLAKLFGVTVVGRAYRWFGLRTGSGGVGLRVNLSVTSILTHNLWRNQARDLSVRALGANT